MRKYKRFYIVLVIVLAGLNGTSFVILNEHHLNTKMIIGISSTLLLLAIFSFFLLSKTKPRDRKQKLQENLEV